MADTKLGRALIVAALVLSFVLSSLPLTAHAQVGSQVALAAAPSYEKALAAVETKIDARRRELGIPGIALAIIKDDQIIYLKGLGYKDFENKVAVTPDTQFAIGSATKAFTALTVLMSQDEGKLKLEDSPKKYLPYFKMYDPEADQKITVRDLMRHASGLNRTDLAMLTGRLTRAELIQVAAQAKPTAKLGTVFQYQNIMFTAAGEIVSQVQKTPWEKFVMERVIKPLGMSNTNLSTNDMARSRDHSWGYNYNSDTKETVKLPYRGIDAVAPAGSINSSVRDMAQWVRFVLNGGTVDGKRLVSQAAYDEWTKTQMQAGAGVGYGYGWFIRDWRGLKVIEHGGNIDGFNSEVAMIPEKKLGFVLLTNVSASPLGFETMQNVWESLLPEMNESIKLPAAAMQPMTGKYRLEVANMDVEVKIVGDDLVMTVPGQRPYTLRLTAQRTFRPEGMPEGFGAKFQPETGDATELVLTQPGRSNTAYRVNADGTLAKPADAKTPAPLSDLVGKYESERGSAIGQVKQDDGKLTFQLPGQPAFTLVERSKDVYSMSPLPADSYTLAVDRDPAGKVRGVTIKQPEGQFAFRNTAYVDTTPGVDIEELHKKIVDALGGETAIRKVTSRVTTFEMDLVHQGVRAQGTAWNKAPDLAAGETTFTALGKPIMLEYSYFNGTEARDITTLAGDDIYTGKRLGDAKLAADLYGILDWKTGYTKVEVLARNAKIGDEECYSVAFTPKDGTKFIEYYSTTTYLAVKREGVQPSATGQGDMPYTITFSDYRDVDGIKIPFRQLTTSLAQGDIIQTVTSVKHNVEIDNKVFAPKKPKF